MSFIKNLFKKKKTPTVLVQRVIRELDYINNPETAPPERKLLRRLTQMYAYLNPCDGKDLIQEKCNELAAGFMETDLVQYFLKSLDGITIEELREFMKVVTILIDQDINHFSSVYLLTEKGVDIFRLLINSYSCSDSGKITICADILRGSIQKKYLHNFLFSHYELLKPLFTDYCQNPNYDVSSDAFATVTKLLRTNKSLISSVLSPEKPLYTYIFTLYNQLIQSSDYVVQRQSLKLLGEFLLDKVNFDIMLHYISDPNNLVVIMKILRNPSPLIQYEAFHVFKVFIANPKKPDSIIEILLLNKQKFIDYLKNLLKERDDEQFNEEKNLLIATLERLGTPNK